MAAKIQDGCQFSPFCRITPYNFSTIEHKREREREREIFIRKKQASRRDMPIKPGAYCLATYQ